MKRTAVYLGILCMVGLLIVLCSFLANRDIQPLIIDLSDTEPLVHNEAARRLQMMGSRAVEPLIVALEDKNAQVRANAIRTLGVPFPMVHNKLAPHDYARIYPLFVKALNDPADKVRAAAADALGYCAMKTDKGPDAVKRLAPLLADPATSVREGAAFSLGVVAEGTEHNHLKLAVDPLAKVAASGSHAERWEAIRALERFGNIAHAAIPVLIDALADEDRSIRYQAKEALGNMTEHTLKILPGLEKAFRTSNAEVRQEIASALRRLGPLPKTALPFLLIALADEDEDVRLTTVWVLGEMNEDAKAAGQALVDLLYKTDEEAKWMIAWNLWKIEKWPRATTILIHGLDNGAGRSREDIAACLGEIGAAARPALGKLRTVARDDREQAVRSAAERAIEKITSGN